MRTKLGLGLAALGRPDYINIRKTKPIDKSVEAFKDNAFKVLDEAYRLGCRHYDVAASYGFGEQFLLDWIADRSPKEISVSTKWGYTYVANWEIGYSGKHEIKEHSLTKLEEQWQFSRQFLPHLNLYQIHSATLESGVLENQQVLQKLFEIKLKNGIKIGISTSGTEQSQIIRKAETIGFDNISLFDSYQITFNVLEQSTFEYIKQLKANGKTVIIKEALANGRIFPWYPSKDYEKARALLQKLSKRHNVGIDAIALRYIIDKTEPDMVLSGASTIAQLQSNVKCLKFVLPLDELKELDTLARKPARYWSERGQLPWH